MIRPALQAGRENGAGTWCERRGLNSQGLLRWILNPVRMPVSPLSHKRAIHCKAMNLTQLRAVGKRMNGLRKSSGRFSQGPENRLRTAPERIFLPADRHAPSFRRSTIIGDFRACREIPFDDLTIRNKPAGGIRRACLLRERRPLCRVQIFLQPVLHGVGRHENTFQAAELPAEITL